MGLGRNGWLPERCEGYGIWPGPEEGRVFLFHLHRLGSVCCPPPLSGASKGLTGSFVAWQLRELLAVARSKLGRPE